MSINKILKLQDCNKPIDLGIIKLPNLYSDKYYNLSYRLVILHAMHNYFKKNKDHRSAEVLLKELESAANNLETSYYEHNFLELYPFIKEKQKGLLIIDRSKGCFPLVLYPEDNDSDHGNRIWGFKIMLSDLLLNYKQYDSLLISCSSWNETLVENLKETFTFPEKNINNNSIDSAA